MMINASVFALGRTLLGFKQPAAHRPRENAALLRAARRSAHTMVELVMAMTSATLLLAGLGTTVLVSSQALQPELTTQQSQANLTQVSQQLLNDLRMATGFSERTARAVTFTVPDRNGDGRPERLRYAWSGVVGQPLQFTYNSLPATSITEGLSDLDFSYITQRVSATDLPSEQDGDEVLFLVRDSTAPSADEASKKSLFESWNFVVRMLGTNESSRSILDAARNVDAVYISSGFATSDASLIRDLTRIKAGIVNERDDFVDDLGFAADSRKTLSSRVARSYESGSHHITAELEIGNNTVLALPAQMLQLESPISPDTNIMATVGGQPALVTLDKNDRGYDDQKINGRRVLLPWTGDLLNQLLLTNQGLNLTRRSLEWASGVGAASLDVRRFGYEQVLNSSFGQVNQQLATRVVLNEPGTLLAISAYVGGTIRPTRFAIYADAGGRPGALIAQSATSNSSFSMEWVTQPVPATVLPSGEYWLAVAFSSSLQSLRQGAAPTGLNASKSHAAVNSGFLPSWGTGASASGGRSIYAIYEVLP